MKPFLNDTKNPLIAFSGFRFKKASHKDFLALV
jgi:hypothetical protein